MKVDVARVLPTGATDVEPARAFLQDRIGLWAFWVFVLSFGFYVTNMVTWSFMRHASARLADMMLQASSLDHLAASIVFGAVWVLTRRVRLSMRALRLLDLATLTVGCMLFALMGAALMRLQSAAGLDPAMGAYAGLLACANTVMARAIAVPSSPRRTLLGSIVAMAPLVAATLVVSRGGAMVTVNVATWCGVSIVIAVVGSRVIFGLRMEAARVRRLGQYTLENKIGSGGMGILSGQPCDATTAHCDQAAAARPSRRGQPCAVRARGPNDRTVEPPEHRGDLRLRPYPRRRLLLRHGVSRRHQSRGPRARARAPAGGPSDRDSRSGVWVSDGGAWSRPRTPRYQAREYHSDRAGW